MLSEEKFSLITNQILKESKIKNSVSETIVKIASDGRLFKNYAEYLAAIKSLIYKINKRDSAVKIELVQKTFQDEAKKDLQAWGFRISVYIDKSKDEFLDPDNINLSNKFFNFIAKTSKEIFNRSPEWNKKNLSAGIFAAVKKNKE